MNLMTHMFDNDWFQRHDIDELQARMSGAQVQMDMARVGEAQTGEQMQLLKARVGQLNLVVEGLLRVLMQHGLVKPDEFTKLLKQIDLEDGEQDGQRNEPRPNVPEWCPRCEARIQPTKTYCVFCGERFDDLAE